MSRQSGHDRSFRTSLDYATSLRRHARLFWVTVLLGVAGGLTFGLVHVSSYTAAASVLVMPTGVTDPNPAHDRAPGGVNLDTEIQFTRSAPVMAAASELINLPPAEVSRHLRIAVPANSRVLKMVYTAKDPVRAADGANAVAKAYLDQRLIYARGILANQIKRKSAQDKELTAELKDASEDVARTNRNTAEGIQARSIAQLLKQQSSQASERLQVLRRIVPTPGAILAAAAPPTSTSGAPLNQRAAEGLMCGVLLACAGVWAAQRRSARIIGVGHLHSLLAPPAVAVQPVAQRAARSIGALTGALLDTQPTGCTVAISSLTQVSDVQSVLDIARQVQAAGYRTAVAVWPNSTAAESENPAAPAVPASNRTVPVQQTYVQRSLQMYEMGSYATAGRRAIRTTVQQLKAKHDFLFVLTFGQAASTHPAALPADHVIIVARDGETTTRQFRRAVTRTDERRVLGALLLDNQSPLVRTTARITHLRHATPWSTAYAPEGR